LITFAQGFFQETSKFSTTLTKDF